VGVAWHGGDGWRAAAGLLELPGLAGQTLIDVSAYRRVADVLLLVTTAAGELHAVASDGSGVRGWRELPALSRNLTAPYLTPSTASMQPGRNQSTALPPLPPLPAVSNAACLQPPGHPLLVRDDKKVDKKRSKSRRATVLFSAPAAAGCEGPPHCYCGAVAAVAGGAVVAGGELLPPIASPRVPESSQVAVAAARCHPLFFPQDNAIVSFLSGGHALFRQFQHLHLLRHHHSYYLMVPPLARGLLSTLVC
jgi:hypothetical protein